jgi:hypothetical protein
MEMLRDKRGSPEPLNRPPWLAAKSARIPSGIGSIALLLPAKNAPLRRFCKLGWVFYSALQAHSSRTGDDLWETPGARQGRAMDAKSRRVKILSPTAIAQTHRTSWLLRRRGFRHSQADEELVVTAVFTAIATGRETLIQTRDTDVFEQFAKLMHLLSADYAAFRYAEVHFHNPDGCPMFPFADRRVLTRSDSREK